MHTYTYARQTAEADPKHKTQNGSFSGQLSETKGADKKKELELER